MDHFSLLLFTCTFSVIFAGVISFNYFSRGQSRSLRHVWVALVCWPLMLACYAISCRYPALTPPAYVLSFMFSVTGLISGMKINLEQQKHDLEDAEKKRSGIISG